MLKFDLSWGIRTNIGKTEGIFLNLQCDCHRVASIYKQFTIVPKAVFNGKDRTPKKSTQYPSFCRFRQMANIGGKGLLGQEFQNVYQRIFF